VLEMLSLATPGSAPYYQTTIGEVLELPLMLFYELLERQFERLKDQSGGGE